LAFVLGGEAGARTACGLNLEVSGEGALASHPSSCSASDRNAEHIRSR
jgi:hypothetical protein